MQRGRPAQAPARLRTYSNDYGTNIPTVNRMRRSSSRFHINSTREFEELPALMCTAPALL